MRRFFERMIPMAALIPVVLLVFLALDGMKKTPYEQVTVRFTADQGQLEALALEALSAGTDGLGSPNGWQGIELYGRSVMFPCGGRGFGPSTSYWGVSYVEADVPVGFQAIPMDEGERKGDGWLWREAQGDNRCYVERLAPCWYYYEAHF